MRSAMRIAHNVRLAAILAVGAFALHQLRYLLTLGSSAELAEAGHRYMTDLLPAVAVLVLAGGVATLIRGTEGALPARPPLGRRIAVFAAALLAIYVGQESLVAILAAGHPASPVMLAAGGWIALPLAVGTGALSVLLATALERVERAIAIVHGERVRSRPPAVRGRAFPARVLSLLSAPLAFGLARRPPPPAPA
ncbi:MAG TPA: hypothetical protein VKA41_07215 [Solirubrobacterales bacterium]|nr:hypothetical protein [Solirubrobacterales bacterium]